MCCYNATNQEHGLSLLLKSRFLSFKVILCYPDAISIHNYTHISECTFMDHVFTLLYYKYAISLD